MFLYVSKKISRNHGQLDGWSIIYIASYQFYFLRKLNLQKCSPWLTEPKFKMNSSSCILPESHTDASFSWKKTLSQLSDSFQGMFLFQLPMTNRLLYVPAPDQWFAFPICIMDYSENLGESLLFMRHTHLFVP